MLDYLEILKPKIDKAIEKYLPKKITKKWLNFAFGSNCQFNSKTVQEIFSKPIWNFLARGGKRWRPALFLLIAEAIGGDMKKVKDFVVIPELLHQGSLVVDDIEDQGELRRGKSCLHRIFGEDIAINAGNFIYFLPLLALIKNRKKFKSEILLKAYETYLQEMMKVHLGQGTDIFWHKGKEREIGERDYLQMAAFKTGSLSRFGAKLAVILSGGSEKLAERLGQMAGAIGIAFQIQDDILDIALAGKEREKFGKSFGNDIKEGKRTLMVIHTFKKANRKDKKRLLEILDKHTENLAEIREAIEIIKKYKAIEYARKISRKIVKDTWEKAENLLPESKAKKRLKGFVSYLIERKI
ncbi:hypothetical protein AUJ10_03890 [Candidatus Pacearchaeota archaeon CG1_02_31_27]|nr:MAG: hypothetical protein AUJ10_03890 [Candidatus Pacearchaeota archaeon CG1_02_31_27]